MPSSFCCARIPSKPRKPFILDRVHVAANIVSAPEYINSLSQQYSHKKWGQMTLKWCLLQAQTCWQMSCPPRSTASAPTWSSSTGARCSASTWEPSPATWTSHRTTSRPRTSILKVGLSWRGVPYSHLHLIDLSGCKVLAWCRVPSNLISLKSCLIYANSSFSF